ncbi:MAG: hypothetical protein NTW86_08520 [Candidatus Sumerlaeota bacterium]|nr:hypothetical protein [Candidatus Sumerlaeota bacterium]
MFPIRAEQMFALAIVFIAILSPIAAQDYPAPVLLTPEELGKADPKELYAVYGADPNLERTEIRGYVRISKDLPLKDRMQRFADLVWGEGHLDVQEIEEVNGRRIATVEMIDRNRTSTGMASDYFWYRHFQGSTGITPRCLTKEFAQDAVDSDWVDEVRFIPKGPLGDHSDGFDDHPIRHGSKVADSDPVERLVLPLRIPRSVVSRWLNSSYSWTAYADYAISSVVAGKGLFLGHRLELWSDPRNGKETLLHSTRCRSNEQPEWVEFDNHVENWHGEKGILKLAIFETNCRLDDLWPPHRRDRVLYIPPGFHFQFIASCPLAPKWNESFVNPDAKPEEREPRQIPIPHTLLVKERRFADFTPTEMLVGRGMSLGYELNLAGRSTRLWPLWSPQSAEDLPNARPDLEAMRDEFADGPSTGSLTLEIFETNLRNVSRYTRGSSEENEVRNSLTVIPLATK